jgi:hypothetical protein
MISSLDGSLSTGNFLTYIVGTALSNYNSSAIAFHNAGGSGSTSNYLQLSMFGANGINIYGTGEVSMPSLPTSAGGGGLYVCVDTSGNMYKKSSCP